MHGIHTQSNWMHHASCTVPPSNSFVYKNSLFVFVVPLGANKPQLSSVVWMMDPFLETSMNRYGTGVWSNF